MKHSSSLCLLFFLVALCSLVQAQVLFQGFNWESYKKQGGWYNSLKAQVDDIAKAGVTHVWLPPPSHSVSPQGKNFAPVYTSFKLRLFRLDLQTTFLICNSKLNNMLVTVGRLHAGAPVRPGRVAVRHGGGA